MVTQELFEYKLNLCLLNYPYVLGDLINFLRKSDNKLKTAKLRQ